MTGLGALASMVAKAMAKTKATQFSQWWRSLIGIEQPSHASAGLG
jgi:alkylated DNA nucleotide flippase Atl1